MFLLPIKKDKWEAYAVCDQNGKSELLNCLANPAEGYQKSAEGLMAIIDKVCQKHHGPTLLPHDISHHIDKKEKILEFIHGKLRLLWFYSSSERRIIICINAFPKKSQKTPKSIKEQAVRVRKQYENDARRGEIFIIDK